VNAEALAGGGVSIAEVIERLRVAGCVAAEREASDLAAAAPDDDVLESWIRRRERGEPLAWITGTTIFCGRRVVVDRGVYVPRPQSERLARRAADLLPATGSAVDLCTGTGAIAVHLSAERPHATVTGLDIDARAVRCARRNGVVAIRADVEAPLRDSAFDVVTAVAPYVPTSELRLLPEDVRRYEPRSALDGGADGLDVLRQIVRSAGRLLRRGGWLLVELGGHQDRALRAVLLDNGFSRAAPWFDDEGDLRGLAAELL
jgi:release factor glutamine methyltransferase